MYWNFLRACRCCTKLCAIIDAHAMVKLCLNISSKCLGSRYSKIVLDRLKATSDPTLLEVWGSPYSVSIDGYCWLLVSSHAFLCLCDNCRTTSVQRKPTYGDPSKSWQATIPVQASESVDGIFRCPAFNRGDTSYGNSRVIAYVDSPRLEHASLVVFRPSNVDVCRIVERTVDH